MSEKYVITVNDGEDIVGTSDPVFAIELIQDAREKGYTVEFTGTPFADFARLAGADDEG